MRTYTIELRADFLEEDKFKTIEAAAKVAAKHLFTTALLLQDKRKPEIALYGGDFFSSTEEIQLADDIPEEETADAEATADDGDAR